VPPWRILLTLGGAGALVGLALVFVYAGTLPRIEAYKAGVLKTAIAEVLHDPARCDTLYEVGGALTTERPKAEDANGVERVFLGRDAAGTPVGFAITTSRVGFSDPIEMIFGYDATTHTLLGMKILQSRETPGIADKLTLPVFSEQFRGVVAPFTGAKESRERKLGGAPATTGDARRDVVMITGATISSRAVIRGINDAIVRWQPLLDAYARGATPAPVRNR
jgi:electron transport complex protein RnfG